MSYLYDVKISLRSSVKLLPEIKGLLLMKPNREYLFRDIVFGPWLDIQSHKNDSHMMHYVFQHQESAEFLLKGLDASAGTVVGKTLSLNGILCPVGMMGGMVFRGFLQVVESDQHIDVWIDLMWSLRPPEADWAIPLRRCIFRLMNRNNIGVLPSLKYVLELYTFYDSLGWGGGISADQYKITYNYAYVPFQASLYGDCGIWVWAGHERFVSDDGHVVFKKHVLVSFDLIGHSFHVHDIDVVFRDGLTVPMCLSSIGNSLILSGSTNETDCYLFCGWSVLVDVTSLTSFTLLFAIPTPNYVKLLGFTMDEISLPIVEVPGPHQLANSVQVLNISTQTLQNLGIQGVAGSFFIAQYKESLILLPYPDPLVDKKKVILTETSIRSDLKLDDAEVFLDKQVEGMSKHNGIYVISPHTKKFFANMKKEGKGFSGRVTPLFQSMMVQASEDMGEDSDAPTDFYSTPIITQQSSLKPQKKKSKRKQRKDSGPTELITETTHQEHVSTPSCDPPQSGEDRMQLHELMNLFNETGERNDEEMLFDGNDDLQGEEVVIEEVAEKKISTDDPVTTAGEVLTTTSIEVTTASAPTTTIDELSMAQTLIEIKAAKPKVPSETTATKTITTAQPSSKDKGEGKMVEPEKPLKKKYQIALNEEYAFRLHAKEQAELESVQRERDAQEEASRAAIIEELDKIQAMIEADEQLCHTPRRGLNRIRVRGRDVIIF
ncbi:hypothetical protein Tco_0225960 [Tanacetum coccineum]